MASAKELLERLTIREIVENWALLRDTRRWDRFREIWHPEGRMITTWLEVNRSAAEEVEKADASVVASLAPLDEFLETALDPFLAAK